MAVCESCNSLVGRADGKLQDYGKVADLVQTDSALQLGLRGRYQGNPFEIVGHAQIEHSAGGVWDEWYLSFREGKHWAWLAESQGQLHLTVQRDLPSNVELPALDELRVDVPVMLPRIGTMKVIETGTGVFRAARGEMPYVPKPGEPLVFADLSGAGSKFATLDYSDESPVLYAGNRVTYEKLGLSGAASRDQSERRVSAVQVNCTQCGGPLELKTPDSTLRVVCPYCGAIHDADHGKLEYLKALKTRVEPLIPLGSVGKFPGTLTWKQEPGEIEFTVIGFLQRFMVYAGQRYYWHEYLLYSPRQPFHWLISSEGHWTLSYPVPAGDVMQLARSARYDGRYLRLFSRCTAEVSFVSGEFYWKVARGEEARCNDFVSAPYLLSREKSSNNEPGEQPGEEINYTFGRYIPVSDVESTFGLEKSLPSPRGIAPNQPFPYKGIYKSAALLFAIALLVIALGVAFSPNETVIRETFTVPRNNAAAHFAKAPFELAGYRNVRVSVSGTPWVYVDGQLFNESTKAVTEFGVPSGRSVYLSALPAGKYTLRVRGHWEQSSTNNASFTVTVRQGVFRAGYVVALLIGLGLIPAGVAAYHLAFESMRWSESDFAG